MNHLFPRHQQHARPGILVKALVFLLASQLLVAPTLLAQGNTVSVADLVPWEAAKDEGKGLTFRATFLSIDRDLDLRLKGHELSYQDRLDRKTSGSFDFATFAQRSTFTLLAAGEDGSFTGSLSVPGTFGEQVKYLVSGRPSSEGMSQIQLTVPDFSKSLDLMLDHSNLPDVDSDKCWYCITTIIGAVATAVGVCANASSNVTSSCVSGCGTGNVSSMSSGVCGMGASCECNQPADG